MKIQLTLDSDLNYRVEQLQTRPLIFSPQIDWADFAEPNIISAY